MQLWPEETESRRLSSGDRLSHSTEAGDSYCSGYALFTFFSWCLRAVYLKRIQLGRHYKTIANNKNQKAKKTLDQVYEKLRHSCDKPEI